MGPLVVLAYSGGLDTSAIVPWLREQYDARVLCYTGDLGQGGTELDGLPEKARASGAIDCIVEDLREPFVRGVIFPTLKAGAVYEGSYLLGTAMARPVTAAGQVAAARQAGAAALAHGCTGKGNDQVRFELTYGALAPELDVIAPWREWEHRGRDDLLTFVASRGIEVAVSEAKPYSRDRNLWHCSHEGGVLEDPSRPPPEDVYLLTRDPQDAPNRPQTVAIQFEQGEPVAVDGEALSPVALLERVNEIGGLHGIGRTDIVENRIVGMKSRGIYETPGGTLLYAAHRELEHLVLDRRVLALKDRLADDYASLVYDGRWWTAEREALDALVTSTQRTVTGSVALRLYKGTVRVVGRESPSSLYRESYATFGSDQVYDQRDAGGFIRLFGLSSRIAAGVAAEGGRSVSAAAD